MKTMPIRITILGIALLLTASLRAEPPSYIVTEITHNGEAIAVLGELDINDNNQILIPNSNFGTWDAPARIWDPNADSLIGITYSNDYYITSAYGINNTAQITGVARQEDPWHTHAFITENYVLTTNLPPLAPAHEGPTCMGSWGFDINSLGQVAGYSNLPDSGQRATAWFNGSPTYIGILPEHEPVLDGDAAGSQAYGISDNGKVVGFSDLTTTEPPAGRGPLGFLWDNGTMTRIPPLAADFRSNARAVNNAGQVVGSAWGRQDDTQYEHAILFENGSTRDIHGDVLGFLNYSEAWDINESGQVVGAFKTATNLAVGAFLYHEGTTYLLDSLIVNAPQGFPGVDLAFAINESGAIVALDVNQFGSNHAYLLTPAVDGYIVNSTSDAPDNDLSDGICNTGGPMINGQPECSFRAAIQQSNAQFGKDKITFDIPAAPVPTITVDSALPDVADSVSIDATTQPVGGRVIVDGSQLSQGNGLSITGGNSSVMGLTISGFPGHGIAISNGHRNSITQNILGSDSTEPAKATLGNAGTGLVILTDSNEVYANRIRANGTAMDTAGNTGHGIEISGSYNIIGSAEPSDANTITGNYNAGISVDQGLSNTIRRQVIYDNGGLGIDIYPLGINPNDSLDSDFGPNNAQNYPVIDSVVDFGSHQTVYAQLWSLPSHSFTVEYYISNECDPSGNGEGKESVWTSLMNTDLNGHAVFQADLSSYSADSQYVTLTATSERGSTSEFSPCWPGKYLLVLDGNESPIADYQFALSKVTNDPPNFTETLLDTVTTDSTGMI
ncbi:hypothetical protein GF356_09100, partial [candidate division GN15 bacterium]|nr:hypothetical protein [candidate division GN15 bacterium]